MLPSPERATALHSLTVLLRQWNQGQERLSAGEQALLVRWAQADLGLPRDVRIDEVDTIPALAARMEALLPRAAGETMPMLFDYVRERVEKGLGIGGESVRWDSSWGDLTCSTPDGRIRLDGDDVSDFLDALVQDHRCAADDPHELLAETVRSIWKARGGAAFWEVAPYEAHWCASQPIFYDVLRIPCLARSSLRRGGCPGRSERIEPATSIDALLRKREHGLLLQSVEARFGVWVGRRPKEGCLPVLIAGALASPLGLLVAMCILISIFDPGKVPGGSWTPFIFWGLGWVCAAVLYSRSQPRLPFDVRTIKDLVRLIAQRRRETARKPRYRPIEARPCYD